MLDPDLAQGKQGYADYTQAERFALAYGYQPFPAVVLHIKTVLQHVQQCVVKVDAAWYRASCLTYYSNLHS
jgi:hypothetical protein